MALVESAASRRSHVHGHARAGATGGFAAATEDARARPGAAGHLQSIASLERVRRVGSARARQRQSGSRPAWVGFLATLLIFIAAAYD